MISTMWTTAPAGVSGPGSLAARAADCVAVWPVARPRALAVAPVFAIAPTGGRLDGTAVPAVQQQPGVVQKRITPNDGTTLGIHSPGRPLS
jgi:hypothetical protein